MKKNRLINIALVLITTIIAFVLAEFGFRAMLFSDSEAFSFLRSPYEYATGVGHKNVDQYDESFWKLLYLFNHQFNVNDPHPLLGWTGAFGKENMYHFEHKKVGDRTPVLLYGDSFAQCVDTTSCFDEILNNDSIFSRSHYLLNYGVGGYGVDQIYLLFRETVDKYKDPFVVFSLLTTDMDRSMLKVRDGQKPYFIFEDGELVIKGTPIVLSSEEYFDQHPPEITSYLWNKFTNSPIYPINEKVVRRENELYGEKVKKLNRAILIRAFDKLKKLKNGFVVLIFHPEHYSPQDWRLTFLRNLCEEHEVPYICDWDLKIINNNYRKYNPVRYTIINDGHPTSNLNRLISKELKKCILDSEYCHRLSIMRSGDDYVSPASIYYYQNQILNSPDWLNHVEEKANEREIPMDSMVMLDAIYMARHNRHKK